jgi:hypothetical protein
MRKSRSIALILILVGSVPAFANSKQRDDYFDHFYNPGPLQNYLVAQDATAKKTNAPPLSPPPPENKGLNFESPDLGPPPANTDKGLTVGPLSNVVFGGTLDYRFLFPKEMPEGMFMIHVNELFVTTNIGDHISVLAEQLLLTSDLGTSVGQDHGFAYVTLSNLPFLLDGMAIRIGRLRMKYGIDAKLDAPANPLRTPEYRTLGLLSDRAIELAGYAGPIEYVAAVSMGPDFVLRDVASPDGSVAGSIKVDSENRSHPVLLRVGTDLKGGSPNFGLSYYSGVNYAVQAQDGFQAGDEMLFGGFVDQHRLVRKKRGSIDARWDIWKLKFSGEYTLGTDSESFTRRNVRAYFFRTDLNIKPQKLILQLQYDRFSDGRGSQFDIGSVGAGLTYYLTDQSWIRGFSQLNEKIFSGHGGSSLAGTQLVFAF